MVEISKPVVSIGPVSATAPGTATFSVASLDVVAQVRDLAFGGNGVIAGIVERKSDPLNIGLRRRVRLYADRGGRLVRETWSDPVTGAFRFSGIDSRLRYTTVAHDYEHNYRAEAADNLQPEVLP